MGVPVSISEAARRHSRRVVRERRAHRRTAFDAPVLLDSGKQHLRVHASNLSAGGLLVSAPGVFAPGTQLDVYFELYAGVAVETRARVARSLSGRIALQFLDLGRDQRRAIRAYCLRPQSAVFRISA